ncbi:MAG TPA: hypothetical protein VLH36_02985 [Steroidobacteraceae bacterium]|nr:hypothetical protein [Steroidobacteraceae bacterium]
MSSPEGVGRFRVPLGSLIVDGALVLTLVFSTGQMLERFDQMDRRVQQIEHLEAATRLNALEMRSAQMERYQGELKQDIVKRLDRIETLLDAQARGR